MALSLWLLGYPDQALKRIHETLTLARELSHSFSVAVVLDAAAWIHQFRREGQATQERAAALIALCTEQGFTLVAAEGTMLRGWALVEQGEEEGIAQIRQGLAVWRATGAEMSLLYFLILLAGAYGKAGQAEEGLSTLSEALTLVNRTGERFYEAELYRIKGQLVLQSGVKKSLGQVQDKSKQVKTSLESELPNTQHPTPSTQAELEAGAEECFHKAIEIARRQQAKSLELRAAMSLSRLWQKQGKKDKARQMLAEIYNWFTEGFDTADLKDAKALLDALS
jgi:predicted ATPase